MPHIQQLDAHIADLIAAGEVVERPASVVKELVENAIDAGASAVVVEIRNGGMSLIRVTDNGCGIAAAELPTAFLRHATSKLRSEGDLGRIATLGFRGEALAAISAVSRVEIESRSAGEETGASLTLEGGVPGSVKPAGVPQGTTVRVRDLFYNTPARLKFMKKDSAETAAVNGLMQHLALSHPAISFKFIKDGTEALHTPGDGKAASAVYAALGREFARSLLPVEGRGGEVAVTGFVTRPLFGRGSRGMQTFFVNGRFIKSQLLTAALEEAYRNQLMKGKFPGCVLSVTLPVTAVDVNVHPAKTQVKFAREREVFDAVYHTVLDALAADGAPAPRPAESTVSPLCPREDFFRMMDAKTYREGSETPPKKQEIRPAVPARPAWDAELRRTEKIADAASRSPVYTTATEESPAIVSGQTPPLRAAQPQRQMAEPEEQLAAARHVPTASAEEEPSAERKPFVPAIPAAKNSVAPAIPAAQKGEVFGQQSLTADEEAPWRIAGELFHTYIICEAEDQTVWLIDKHAAHERIHFDRMKASPTPPMPQTLLVPIAAELQREDGALLLENLELLEQFGFACEDFGGDTLLVRAIPAELPTGEVTATLEELAGKLRSGRSPEERREALLHTMACKAAIKGGWVSDPAELQVLVERVQSGEIRYCPHGRPVAVKLTKYELEKMFRRA